MFDELTKYKHSNHFIFTTNDNLRFVCNAPSDKSGVYIVYALKGGRVDMVYIGCSGRVRDDGSLFIRKTGLGGIKDRIVNGKQFGEPRRISWKERMFKERIEALDVYWYVTHNDTFTDCPRILENALLKKHHNIYGRLPKWNNEF